MSSRSPQVCPSVVQRFPRARCWRPTATTDWWSSVFVDRGKHLGDSWYFVDDDTIHCYYLVCPETVERHSAWDIAHATSRDLETWTLHGIVVERSAPGDWDEGCLATGSVIRTPSHYLMAYSVLRDSVDVATGLAVSDDAGPSVRRGSRPGRPAPNQMARSVPAA